MIALNTKAKHSSQKRKDVVNEFCDVMTSNAKMMMKLVME